VDGKLALKFRKAFETAKHKGLDVKIVLSERNKRYLSALSQFGEVFSISLKKILNEGLIVSLPFILLFQRMMVLYLIERSRYWKVGICF